jgi:hypothetical protein
VAVNMNTAGWPVARLRGALGRGQLERWHDVVLLAIAEAAGLGGLVLHELSTDALAYRDRVLGDLLRHADFSELVAQTVAAVGGAVLTG